MSEIAYWFWWNCYGKWKIRRECRRMTQAQRRDAAVANFKMFREQAIRDVAAFTGIDVDPITGWMTSATSPLLLSKDAAVAYAVAQRERTLELEAQLEEAENKLRAHDGLVALRNGIPETTGDPVFDKVLRLFPVAAMLQRSWLAGVTGFDELPFLYVLSDIPPGYFSIEGDSLFLPKRKRGERFVVHYTVMKEAIL